MSRLTQTPPVINLNPAPSGPVRVHLDEPFLHRQRSRKIRSAMQLLSLLGRLELVLKKREAVQALPDHARAEALLQKLDGEIETINVQMESAWTQFGAKDKASREKYSKDMKLPELFPRAVNMVQEGAIGEPIDSHSLQAHFQQVALYDQLYANASRLERSLELSNHEYIPYQMVVVFQCMNHVDMAFAEYRDKIQRRFDDIRGTITSQQERGARTPVLGAEQKAWLKDIMAEIATQALCGNNSSKLKRFNRLTDTATFIHHLSKNG